MTDLQRLWTAELGDKLPDRFGLARELPEAANLLPSLSDCRSDRFRVDIQPQVSCILARDWHLLCGSAPQLLAENECIPRSRREPVVS